MARQLRPTFRKTGLVARDGTDFWLLLPYMPAIERLLDKLRYIVQTAWQGGMQIVERDISIFRCPSRRQSAPGRRHWNFCIT